MFVAGHYPVSICSPCGYQDQTTWKEEYICSGGTTLLKIAEYAQDPPFPTGQVRYFTLKGLPVLEPTSFVPGSCTGSTGSVTPPSTPSPESAPFHKQLINHTYGVIPATEHGKGIPADVVLTDSTGQQLLGGVTIDPTTGNVTIQSVHPRTLLVTIQ